MTLVGPGCRSFDLILPRGNKRFVVDFHAVFQRALTLNVPQSDRILFLFFSFFFLTARSLFLWRFMTNLRVEPLHQFWFCLNLFIETMTLNFSSQTGTILFWLKPDRLFQSSKLRTRNWKYNFWTECNSPSYNKTHYIKQLCIPIHNKVRSKYKIYIFLDYFLYFYFLSPYYTNYTALLTINPGIHLHIHPYNKSRDMFTYTSLLQ